MSFREMRRKDRQVFDDSMTDIMEKGEFGVLSVIGENDYPYGVPVNYVYQDGRVYFHCAKTGHKLDAIMKNDRVSFCIVTDTELLPETFSTKYKSVIAFGRAFKVEGEEKTGALMGLVRKYSPGFIDKGRAYVSKESGGTTVVGIEIEHITGKARI